MIKIETYKDTSQKESVNSHLIIAQDLTNEEQISRTTKVTFSEVAKLSIIEELGKMQDRYREKYLDIKTPCFLTGIVRSNLRLRMSEGGWRAIQIKEIASSPKIENSEEQNKNGITLNRNLRI